VGSLRSLRHNPLAKKNQKKKPKPSWRGLLAKRLREKIRKECPGVLLRVTPHYHPYRFVEVAWDVPSYPSPGYLHEIGYRIEEVIKAFAEKRGLDLVVTSPFKNSLCVARNGEE
jgi:hypothetical protein